MLSLPAFQQKFSKIYGGSENSVFLLALSGGADSMVLADLFLKANMQFQVAHVNYHLRGQDSCDDQQIVEDFCHRNNIKFHLLSVGEEEKPEGSIQLWAREIRYDFFEHTLQKENLNTLVTAHHLNDQVETFFINLLRGSGIRGLSGMPEKTHQLLRPLLSFSKKEIYKYAKEHNITYREDLSNKKNVYVRNRLRNKIIPELEEINPNFLPNFSKSIQLLNDMKIFSELQISTILNQISFEKENEIIIDKENLAKQLPFVRFEILYRFGFSEEREMEKIFSAVTGSFFYSKTFIVLVNRNELIITKRSNIKKLENRTEIIVASSPASLPSDQKIRLSNVPELTGLPPDFCWNLSMGKLIFPLKLRHQNPGDVFFPVGMEGKKKVSKFFKDEKISILAKQKIWILCDGKDQILGIIPFRQDRRFVANPNSSDLLNLIV